MYNNYNNPYYLPNIPNQRYQPVDQINQPINNQPFMQPTIQQKPLTLQGKSVDSIDVVKATDIPMDGSISYFPISDGSAIVTKQLQNDGTSKITVFKPFTEEKKKIEYITREELKNALNELNLDELDDIKEQLREIKKQMKKKGE